MYDEHEDPLSWRRAYKPQIHIDTTDSGWSPSSPSHIESSTLPPEITFDPPSPESGWMDPTQSSTDIDIGIGSVDFEFDDSCFDALDEQLLLHPVQSFADVCWADAVQARRASSQNRHESAQSRRVSTSLSVVSVTATLNSRRESYGPQSEQDQQQPAVCTRSRTQTTSRLEARAAASVRWADDEALHEGVHRSRSAAELRQVSESHRDHNTELLAPPPFSDRLNVVMPLQQQQPLVAEPLPLAKFPPAIALTPPTPTTPASAITSLTTCLNPRHERGEQFVLNLNLTLEQNAGAPDPNESIGFFPSRPPPGQAPKSKAFKSAFSASLPASPSSSSFSKMPRFLAYFHTRRRRA
ncbi:hypothetical protein MSAN_00668100 [Mycena sanguinolenta]|uniref:Uncharacterized protein n=1 Tax=Mycena sanguinolenta TaxID=230812 RepID=A0A8H6Z4U1_9AGAR|nr:hypothetical protein MSAN_00668100 [Mycena sanguinolenta]